MGTGELNVMSLINVFVSGMHCRKSGSREDLMCSFGIYTAATRTLPLKYSSLI